MATVLDLGLLREFSEIFSWLLILAVSYAILSKVGVFPSRGINALIAVAVTVLLSSTTATTDVINGMLPWFVITAFFALFLVVLGNFVGIQTSDVLGAMGGRGVTWWFFTIMVIGVVISLVSSGQFSRGSEPRIDPETGQEISTTGRTVINVLTEPKILALILVLSISAIAVALMAGAPRIIPQ